MERTDKVAAVRRLYDAGVFSHDIAVWVGKTVDEVDLIIDEYEAALELIRHHYQESHWPSVLASVKEIKQHMPDEERVELQKENLLYRIQEERKVGITPALEKMVKEAKILTGRNEGISPERVAKAREFPLIDLVGPRRNGMASCPFHKDKTPSMDVRKNFYHCYSCGEHGDVIDYVMKTENLTFKQAVNRLTT